MTGRERIEDFLAQKRLAVAGVSHRKRDFSRLLFKEFVRRGYDAVPVNPRAGAIDGRRCFARVQDISPPVDGVLVMTSARQAESVVMDCAAAGVGRVWLYRAIGKGAVSKAAVDFCKSKGILVIAGHCPYMFWSDASLVHRLHRYVKMIAGACSRQSSGPATA
jgi:O-acetylhomoserine (thiol)-lyase